MGDFCSVREQDIPPFVRSFHVATRRAMCRGRENCVRTGPEFERVTNGWSGVWRNTTKHNPLIGWPHCTVRTYSADKMKSDCLLNTFCSRWLTVNEIRISRRAWKAYNNFIFPFFRLHALTMTVWGGPIGFYTGSEPLYGMLFQGFHSVLSNSTNNCSVINIWWVKSYIAVPANFGTGTRSTFELEWVRLLQARGAARSDPAVAFKVHIMHFSLSI